MTKHQGINSAWAGYWTVNNYSKPQGVDIQSIHTWIIECRVSSHHFCEVIKPDCKCSVFYNRYQIALTQWLEFHMLGS